ncbi:hypothetical protein MRY87_05095 [bacterium]|nr:hypothetical protein [bacterium]
MKRCDLVELRRKKGDSHPGGECMAVELLVAHRGDMVRWAENTLGALEAVLEAGVSRVEFDIQLSSDQVPMVFHDRDLARMTGRRELVSQLSAQELTEISCHTPAARGVRRESSLARPEQIVRLTDAVSFLNRYPAVTAYVELKREPLEWVSRELFVERVLAELASAQFAPCIISFDVELLVEVRRQLGSSAWKGSPCTMGIVLSDYTEEAMRAVEQFSPECVFCDVKKLPEGGGALWSGSYEWVIYEVTRWADVEALRSRGAHLFESGDCLGMLSRLPEFG